MKAFVFALPYGGLAAILLLLVGLSPLATAQTTFTVTDQPKTAAHPYHGQGDPNGYAIDGVEGAELTLTRGVTYIFQMSDVSPMHPFYISTSSSGAGAGVWSDGVTGNFATGNQTVTFTVPQEAPDLLWYQCAAHLYMGWQINVVDGESDAFTAVMSGGQEIPANASRAGGTVNAVLTGTTLVVSGSFEGLVSPFTGAHLHLGYAGQNGPVEIGLTPQLEAGEQAGIFVASDNTFELDADQVDALLERRLYVNVHSTTYPPGEIRGQVLPAAGSSFHAALTGRAEIPANASAAIGAVMAELDGTTLTVTGSFSELGSNYAASHIHIGELHESGPAVFTLGPNLDGGLRAGTYAAANNTFELTADQVDALLGGEYYINVHSQLIPPGEVRGQLVPTGTQTFEAFMLGIHESEPVSTGALGGVIAHLEGQTLRVGGSFSGLKTDYTAAHIHQGVVGVSGGVVFPLEANLEGEYGSGTFPVDQNTFTLTNQQVGLLFTEGFYVNVHTVDEGPGEIRGQLLVATNLAPVPPEITDPEDGSTIHIEGQSTQTVLIAWDASDPNLNRMGFRWQIAADPNFQVVVLDEFVGLSTSFEVPHAVIDELMASLGVEPGESVTIYHRITASDGGFATTGPASSVTLVRAVVSDEPGAANLVFTVAGPAPNPFTNETTLFVDIPEAAQVTVTLFDVLGRRVGEQALGVLSAGARQPIDISGGGLAPGMYIYRVEAVMGGETHTASGRVVRHR